MRKTFFGIFTGFHRTAIPPGRKGKEGRRE